VEFVNQLKEHMEGALEEAKAALSKSKDDMAKYYNRKQTLSLDYKPRDKVYLDASDIQTTDLQENCPTIGSAPFPSLKRLETVHIGSDPLLL
jgi:hypothetical protein